MGSGPNPLGTSATLYQDRDDTWRRAAGVTAESQHRLASDPNTALVLRHFGSAAEAFMAQPGSQAAMAQGGVVGPARVEILAWRGGDDTGAVSYRIENARPGLATQPAGGRMAAGERELSRLWHEIEALLAGARAARPLQQSDTLLDLDHLPGGAAVPLLAQLARALGGWEGRLLLRAPDDALAPTILADDRLVIDPEIAANDGQLVVAFAAGALTIRRLRVRGGQTWLDAGPSAPIALDPLVAILGVVVELRRAP